MKVRMENIKLGHFIAETRKQKQMTQRDLADRLHITDKAVSKWERGLSCPDIALLSPLADALGVTTSELLNCIKDEAKPGDSTEEVLRFLTYAESNTTKRIDMLKRIFTISYTASIFIAIIVCAIVDVAINQCFTWSLFPLGSCIYAWCIFFPIIYKGRKGILPSIIALTVLTIPYFVFLSKLLPYATLLLPIGIQISILSLLFIWLCYIIIRVLRSKLLVALAIDSLLIIPFTFSINFSLSKLIGEPIFDLWDLIVYCIAALFAAVALIFMEKRKEKKEA